MCRSRGFSELLKTMRPNYRNGGFVLISAAGGILAIIGMLGLATDVGRLYIVKTELQGNADLAAMAAAYALDGTAQGIVKARSLAQNGFGAGAPLNRWNFATQTVSTPQVTFGTLSGAIYTSAPANPVGVIFVQVSVAQTLRLFFLPIMPSISANSTVSATAIAGQAVRSTLGNGLAPFSPSAHNPADPNFGFTIGGNYTLKWPPPGQQGKPGTSCSGDAGFTPNHTIDQRGFMDVGLGSGNSVLHDAIVNNDFNLPSALSIGSAVPMVTGNKDVAPAVVERFNQDTDRTAATYSSYAGNGRRILMAPVNDNTPTPHVAGFGAFLLHPGACMGGNSGVCCGEYIGSAVSFSNHKGGAVGGGLYVIKLFR